MRLVIQTEIQTVNRTNCFSGCQFFFGMAVAPMCALGCEQDEPITRLKSDKRGRPVRCPACRKAEVAK